MRDRLFRIAKWFAYPLFYLACLGLFGYLTFPYEKLKDRILAEFDRKAKPGQRLEIGKISSYWFSGVELTNVKLTLPPDDAPGMGGLGYPGANGGELAAAMPSPAAAKESVITVDEAHARVRLLPLLIGRVRVDFWASALDGEISGTVPVGAGGGDIHVELSKIEIGKIEPLVQAIGGIPLKGTADGKLELTIPDGKVAKAGGSFELTVADVMISDGKTKIQGMLELPPAKLGTLTLTAEAKDGTLKITKLEAKGPDLELVGDGRITMKEPWNESQADLYLRFKFTDAYRAKNDITKSLLGEPGSTLPALMEMQVPKMKKAKRPDGFFGWHMHGPLKNPRFDPSASDSAPAGAAGAGRPKKIDAGKKPSGLSFPLGTSTANDPPPPPAAPIPEAPPPTPVPTPPPAAPPPPPIRVVQPPSAEMEPIHVQPPPQAPPPPDQPPPPPTNPDGVPEQPQPVPQ